MTLHSEVPDFFYKLLPSLGGAPMFAVMESPIKKGITRIIIYCNIIL